MAGVAALALFFLAGCAGTDTVPDRPPSGSLPEAPASSPPQASAPTGCQLSQLQQDLLDETNRRRQQGQRCGFSNMPPVAPVSWDCRLGAAAQGHSDDMARYSFLEHTGSDGLKLIDRLGAQGYNPQAWGENIAQGQKTVGEVVDDWVQSTGHCKILMSQDYVHMGAAMSTSADGDTYWTQDFAAPL